MKKDAVKNIFIEYFKNCLSHNHYEFLFYDKFNINCSSDYGNGIVGSFNLSVIDIEDGFLICSTEKGNFEKEKHLPEILKFIYNLDEEEHIRLKIDGIEGYLEYDNNDRKFIFVKKYKIV